MPWRSRGRAAVFFLYLSSFFVLPLTILFETEGLLVALALTVLLIVVLRWNALSRLDAKLGARPLSHEEAGALYSVVGELSRRLGMETPSLYLIETPAMNVAVYGFRPGDTHIALTQGMRDSFSRDELSARLAAELCSVASGECTLHTWLSLFLGLFDGWVSPRRVSKGSAETLPFSFSLLIRQVVLYPLALVALVILKKKERNWERDLNTAKLSRFPGAYASALRKLEAYYLRLPFSPRFSVRHLFLVAPPSSDPIARVLFEPSQLRERVANLEKATLTLVT